MKWDVVICTIIIAALIFWVQWPRLKQNPIKDKLAFCTILLIGSVLMMADLYNWTGPTAWIEALFRPFSEYMLR